ncbi:type III secretion protein [Stutzerimonas marianensis]
MSTATLPLREQMADLSAWLPAERLAECFGGALSPEQAQALAAPSRFRGRIAQLVAQRFELANLEQAIEGLSEADLQVLQLPAPALARLPRWCGAVLHGATLAREIRREQVALLQQQLGRELFAFAVAQRTLGRSANLLLEAEALVVAIDRDGQACLGAWVETLAPATQGWARLILPGLPASTDARAGEIVRLVARVLAAESKEEQP